MSAGLPIRIHFLLIAAVVLAGLWSASAQASDGRPAGTVLAPPPAWTAIPASAAGGGGPRRPETCACEGTHETSLAEVVRRHRRPKHDSGSACPRASRGLVVHFRTSARSRPRVGRGVETVLVEPIPPAHSPRPPPLAR